MADRDVSYKVTADTKQAQQAVDQLAKKSESADTSITSLRTSYFKAAAVVSAVVGTVAGLVAAYREQEQAEIKIAQTLKNTGYAAGLSAKELGDFATQLQSVTTFGDEAILSAEAVLLRFDSIGRDVFPRATEATLDLAQGLGIDLESAARLLGKALQEPTEGLNGLRKAGIFFTGEQENIIQSAINAGDAIKAQSIVLDELNSKFGGLSQQAASGTGALIQTKNILGEIAESGGKILLPFVLKLNEGLATSAKFWQEVANSIANVSTNELKQQITDTEIELGKLEGAYKQAKAEQDNLVENKGFQSARDNFQKAESDILNYGVTSGNTAKTILAQWTELSGKLSDLRSQQTEAEKRDYAGSVEGLKQANALKKEEQDRYDAAIKTLNEQYRISKDDEFLSEQDAIQNQLLKIQALEEKASFDKIKADQSTATAIAGIEKKTLELRKKNTDESIKLSEEASKKQIEDRRSTYNTIATLADSNNKTLAAIGKAAAITTATIDGIVAVQKALSAFPPPFNFVAAGLVGVATAANIAKIGGVKLADGGLVGGPTPYGNVDMTPAMLQKGELVSPRQNFDEVVEAVARQRGFTKQDEQRQNQAMDVRIGFTENAFELIETKLLQRQALGV